MRITSETTINPKHQTMNCPNCNSTLPDDARFCGHCGAAIPSVISTEPEPPESPEDGNDSGGQPSEPYTWEGGMCHGTFAASFLLVLSLFYAAGWDFWFVRHIGRLFTCVAVLFFSAILYFFLIFPAVVGMDGEKAEPTPRQKHTWIGAYVALDVVLIVIAIAIRLAGVRHLPKEISEGVRERYESELRKNNPGLVHLSAFPLCNVRYEGDYVWTADLPLTVRHITEGWDSGTVQLRITADYEQYQAVPLGITSDNP